MDDQPILQAKRRLPIIAIAGGIGSGKSVVAREFASQGGHLILADELGHEALRQPEIKGRIVAQWGKDVLDNQGNIARRRLGQIVFAHPAERKRLEEIVFPFIKRRMTEEKEKANRSECVRFIVLDAAVLLEAGWTDDVSHLVFVEAPREIRLERLMATRGWDARELDRREQSQIPLEQKKQRADAIITNTEGLDSVAQQVSNLLNHWKLG